MTDFADNNLDANKQQRIFKVLNQYGMHARPAALFVKTANQFESEILVEKDGIQVSGKSIMGILTIEGHQGAKLIITAIGVDAVEALDAFQELFDNNFYEQ